jgi:hypothetical protein
MREVSTGQKMKAATAVYEVIIQSDDYDRQLAALIELSELLDISIKSILADYNNFCRKKDKYETNQSKRDGLHRSK